LNLRSKCRCSRLEQALRGLIYLAKCPKGTSLADLGRAYSLDGEAAHCRHWSPGLSPQSEPAAARGRLRRAPARRRSARPAGEVPGIAAQLLVVHAGDFPRECPSHREAAHSGPATGRRCASGSGRPWSPRAALRGRCGAGAVLLGNSSVAAQAGIQTKASFCCRFRWFPTSKEHLRSRWSVSSRYFTYIAAAELSLPFLGQLVQEIGKGAEFKRYLLQDRAQALYQVFNSQGVEFEGIVIIVACPRA
jgi:hypothetical protein